jgi:hypothetical protein
MDSINGHHIWRAFFVKNKSVLVTTPQEKLYPSKGTLKRFYPAVVLPLVAPDVVWQYQLPSFPVLIFVTKPTQSIAEDFSQ